LQHQVQVVHVHTYTSMGGLNEILICHFSHLAFQFVTLLEPTNCVCNVVLNLILNLKYSFCQMVMCQMVTDVIGLDERNFQ
jgi:hypothetical protein